MPGPKPVVIRRAAKSKPVRKMPSFPPISHLRRWFNRAVLTSGALLLCGGIYEGTERLGAQQVERLTIVGDVRHIDTDALQTRLAPRVADGFLAADLMALRQELESLPWVYRVNTRRRWPAEIEVSLTEQRPLARWGEQGYLNHEGQYFSADPDPLYDDLPWLKGPEGSETSLMRRYQTLAGLLAPTGLAIRELSLDPLGQIAMRFDTGLTLLLGAKDMSHRIARFIKLWDEELPVEAVATVDLRYEHGAAVTLSENGLAMQAAQKRGEG